MRDSEVIKEAYPTTFLINSIKQFLSLSDTLTETENLNQETFKFVPSDIKLITHPQQHIFTAVKSEPSFVSTEEIKSEIFAPDCLSGNRKRKVPAKHNTKNNKNTKSQVSTVNQVGTQLVSKTEVKGRLYQKLKGTSNVLSKYVISVISIIKNMQ